MGKYVSNFDEVYRQVVAQARDVVDELAYECRDNIVANLSTGGRGLSRDTGGAIASIYVVRAGLSQGRAARGYSTARKEFISMRLQHSGGRLKQSRSRGKSNGRRGNYTREEVEKLVLPEYVPARDPDVIRASVASCSKDLAFWEAGWRTKFRNRNGRTQSRREHRPQFYPAIFTSSKTAAQHARQVMARRRRSLGVNAKARLG